MNERTKILELLQEGKISVEQADMLLAALDEKSNKPPFTQFRLMDRGTLSELKNVGTQVASAVKESLADVKKSLDLEEWSFGFPPRVTTTVELTLDEAVEALSVETQNGQIKVSVWDQPYARIYIRGQVRTKDLAEAKNMLQAALQTHQTEHLYQLSVINSREVGGASLDLFIPRSFQRLYAKTQNGRVQVDSASLEELQLETFNGSILLYQVQALRMRLSTHNGSVDLRRSIQTNCENIHAVTHNGRIDVDGIAEDVTLLGTAKTNSGKVDIAGVDLEMEPSDSEGQRRYARFRTANKEGSTMAEQTTDIYLETHNGSIVVRA